MAVSDVTCGAAIATEGHVFSPSASATIAVFDDAHCAELETGNLYVVVTTDLYPEGEIRDQIYSDPPHAIEPATWGRIKATYD